MEIKGELRLIRIEEEKDTEAQMFKTCEEYPGIPQTELNTLPLRIAGYFAALGAQDGDLICNIDDDWPDINNAHPFKDLCRCINKGIARRGVIVFESITRRRKWAARYEIVNAVPVTVPLEAAPHDLDTSP